MISSLDIASGDCYEVRPSYFDAGLAIGKKLKDGDVVLVEWENHNDEYLACYDTISPGMAWAFYRLQVVNEWCFPRFYYIVGTDKFQHTECFPAREPLEGKIFILLRDNETLYSDEDIREFYKEIAENRLYRPGWMPIHESRKGRWVFVPKRVLDALCMVFNKDSYTADDVVKELCDEVRSQMRSMEEYEKDGFEKAAKIRAVLNGESKEEE